jgi:hypothetical protein
MELSAELVQFLDSLPGTVVFVTADGEVLVFQERESNDSRANDNLSGSGARFEWPGTDSAGYGS